MSTVQILCGSIAFVFNISAAAFMIYGMCIMKAKRERNVVQFAARHYSQLNYLLIWFILFTLTERNIQLCGGILELFELPFIARLALHNLFIIGFMSLLILRIWLIYFDFSSGNSMLHLITNADLTESNKHALQWFLDNQRNFGGSKYLTRVTFTGIIMITLYISGWVMASPGTTLYVMVFVYAILVLLCIRIIRYIGHIEDNFFIAREIWIQFYIFITVIVVTTVLILFGSQIGWIWVEFLLCEIFVVFALLIYYSGTYWVMKKNDIISGTNVDELVSTESFEEMCRDRKEFQLFLEHLIKEDLVVAVIFLADIMAFKKEFVAKEKLHEISGFACPVDSSMQRLIFRRSFTHYSWAIGKTYVDGDATLAVKTLSNDVRDNCVGTMEELDPNDVHLEVLHTLFDECGQELYHQMQQSYARFQRSTQIHDQKSTQMKMVTRSVNDSP